MYNKRDCGHKKRKMPFHDDLSPSPPPPLTGFVLNVVGECAISDWRSDYAAQIAQIRRGYRHGIINSVLLRIGCCTGTPMVGTTLTLSWALPYCSVVYIPYHDHEAKKLDCAECICIIGRDKHQRVHAVEIHCDLWRGVGVVGIATVFQMRNVSLIKCVYGNEAI